MNIFRKTITNKEFISIFLLTFTFLILIYSTFLLPIIISIIISYLLCNLTKFLENKIKISHQLSFIIIYILFITVFLLILFILLPSIFKQLVILFNDLPFIIQKVKFLTYKFIEKYPILFSPEQTNLLFSNIITYVQSIGKTIISASILSVAIIIKWILYILLIPILVFFLMKDNIKIIEWFKKLTPKKTFFLKEIWNIINKQISNYIRGKILEMIIMIITHYILFKYYSIPYAELLSFLIGISVIIPYIGTIIVSIPILLISSIQLGISSNFIYFSIIYALIQFIDGNLLVPILFSEAVNLHPLSIMISIIIFGSTLDFYGVFFAIPLAIFIKAIIELYLTSKN